MFMETKEKVTRKVENLQKCIGYLRSKSNVPIEDIENNYELRSAIERNLQLAIEICIDIGEMIISNIGVDRPENYRDVITILGKNNILPLDFADDFARAAGMRNILVHAYDEIDLNFLKDVLDNQLVDFDVYIQHILDYLEGKREK